ncbi:hypothetical protein M8J75_007010 [Diaphorina citri]|nr:hypothetical protein M8J75_007010 [Diaphorina citri]
MGIVTKFFCTILCVAAQYWYISILSHIFTMGIVTKFFCTILCVAAQYWYISIPGALLVLLKMYNQMSMGIYKKGTMMNGKTVIITGANSGLGEVTALDMASRGARVIMACRDLGKANGVRESIITKTNNHQVVVKKLDLASLDSVREFAAQILDEEKHIHVLINNAGQGGILNRITKDGLQLGMQVNYFGHFLLTNLLLGRIRDSAPSRIVNVSSVAHRYHKLDLNDLQWVTIIHACQNLGVCGLFEHYNDWTVYGNAKLCNILMTTYLSKLVDGTGVTANSVHPGIVATHAFDRLQRSSPWMYAIIMVIVKNFCKTPEQGAQAQIYAACDPDLDGVSGKYFQDCHESRCIAPEAQDMRLAEQLWRKSVDLVKLTKSEINY